MIPRSRRYQFFDPPFGKQVFNEPRAGRRHAHHPSAASQEPACTDVRGGLEHQFALAQPDPIARRRAQRLAKMGDRGLSEILEAEQYFIRRLADLADGLQARGNENVPNSRGKLHLVYWCVVRKFRSRIELTWPTHFPSALF